MNKISFLLPCVFSLSIQFALIPNGALSNPERPDNINIWSEWMDSTGQITPEGPDETLVPPRSIVKWRSQYKQYLVKFNKSPNRNHLKLYQKNLEDVFRHNNDKKNTWKKGVNMFTDMTDEEAKHFTGYNYNREFGGRSKRSVKDHPPPSDVPLSLDYRDMNFISPVKNQGECGSCFAFALASVMESKYAMLNVTVVLSEQSIVDCIKKNASGCNGGSFRETLNFMEDVGVDTESNNKYTARGNQSCKSRHMKYDHRVMSWMEINQNEKDMMEALNRHGPIAAAVFVDENFWSYSDGIFNVPDDTEPNHAVTIVGYGEENGIGVWYIKNSWGQDWGQGGFMTMERGVNLRRIADGPYAIVNVTAILGKRREVYKIQNQVLVFPPSTILWAFTGLIVVVVVIAILVKPPRLYNWRNTTGPTNQNLHERSPLMGSLVTDSDPMRNSWINYGTMNTATPSISHETTSVLEMTSTAGEEKKLL